MPATRSAAPTALEKILLGENNVRSVEVPVAGFEGDNWDGILIHDVIVSQWGGGSGALGRIEA
jgi:hypothetical protein